MHHIHKQTLKEKQSINIPAEGRQNCQSLYSKNLQEPGENIKLVYITKNMTLQSNKLNVIGRHKQIKETI